MLYKVFNKEVDFDYNRKVSLFANKIIDKINDKLFKKIAVVGGGIFGSTAAVSLANNG